MGNLQLGLHQVISFYYVAKEQSYSRAAEALSITQPAVTQHIRGLEVQYGVKLINIKKKRVSLTKAGERLLPYAEDIFNMATLTENFLKGYRFNHISIGIASPLVYFFTALINHFKELHPSVRVSIQDGSSMPLVEELLDFKLDICMVGILFPYNERVRLFRLPAEEQLFFVAAPDYPLPSDGPLKWLQLSSFPLIIQAEGSASRAMLLNNFKKRGLKPLIGAEVNNVGLAKQLARQKKGIAFMFEANILEELAEKKLKIIPVEDGYLKMGAIDILVNREEKISPAVESLLDLIKSQFKGKLLEISPK
jgi:DNA-binding transcriptional LysR family regulator